ncbi:MAG: hypothetical protein AAGA77_01350 [Bacteroidota bacterium]
MQLRKVISTTEPQYLSVGEYSVLKLVRGTSISNIKSNRVDAILVDDESVLKSVLSNDSLYLKPMFFHGYTQRQCDGIVQTSDLALHYSKIKVLKEATEEYEHLSLPSTNDKRLLCKILRYLLSRKISLEPINTRKSDIGYSFALVEDMSVESNPLHIMSHLNEFAKQDYFSTTVTDKINICYDCNSSYLNFSECCTKCNSLDLKSEELVHHFRCAYVGPQSDFVKDDKLICPKCDHQLKHIGIDYDKPSEIHICKSCNHSSQETKMKAKCTDCGKENELDQLVTHAINSYAVSEKGRNFALSEEKTTSFEPVSNEESDVLIHIGAFRLLKSHESKRSKNNGLGAYNMICSFDSFLLSKLNPGMQMSLITEIAGIIKPYLKPNDLIAIDDNKNIELLLIDYSEELYLQTKETLAYNLNKMLADNGWADKKVVEITGINLNS